MTLADSYFFAILQVLPREDRGTGIATYSVADLKTASAAADEMAKACYRCKH